VGKGPTHQSGSGAKGRYHASGLTALSGPSTPHMRGSRGVTCAARQHTSGGAWKKKKACDEMSGSAALTLVTAVFERDRKRPVLVPPQSKGGEELNGKTKAGRRVDGEQAVSAVVVLKNPRKEITRSQKI